MPTPMAVSLNVKLFGTINEVNASILMFIAKFTTHYIQRVSRNYGEQFNAFFCIGLIYDFDESVSQSIKCINKFFKYFEVKCWRNNFPTAVPFLPCLNLEQKKMNNSFVSNGMQ